MTILKDPMSFYKYTYTILRRIAKMFSNYSYIHLGSASSPIGTALLFVHWFLRKDRLDGHFKANNEFLW